MESRFPFQNEFSIMTSLEQECSSPIDKINSESKNRNFFIKNGYDNEDEEMRMNPLLE